MKRHFSYWVVQTNEAGYYLDPTSKIWIKSSSGELGDYIHFFRSGSKAKKLVQSLKMEGLILKRCVIAPGTTTYKIWQWNKGRLRFRGYEVFGLIFKGGS